MKTTKLNHFKNRAFMPCFLFFLGFYPGLLSKTICRFRIMTVQIALIATLSFLWLSRSQLFGRKRPTSSHHLIETGNGCLSILLHYLVVQDDHNVPANLALIGILPALALVKPTILEPLKVQEGMGKVLTPSRRILQI